MENTFLAGVSASPPVVARKQITTRTHVSQICGVMSQKYDRAMQWYRKGYPIAHHYALAE